MFYYVYILQNKIDGNLYTGRTGDLRRRIEEHNAGKNLSTKSKRPWTLIFYEAYRKEGDAVRRERYLKTSQGSRLLKRMLKEYMYEYKRLKDSNRISTTRWTG